MASSSLLSVSSSLFVLLIVLAPSLLTSAKKTYIVHVNNHAKPSSFATHHDWYTTSLASSDSLMYSYTTAFHGFSASLDMEEVESLRESQSVIAVYEDTVYNLHTTRTPEFLGLNDAIGLKTAGLDRASYDVIIGVLDTGVSPGSKSFDDATMPEIPSRWRGGCEIASDFPSNSCNKKLIGARSFGKGFIAGSGGRKSTNQTISPHDQEGHGTHTATTAAGSSVANASLFGYASGTARGMATHARIAAYKVCWGTSCFGSDILAAMDQAISDGVDVLSLSLGGSSGPYYNDPIATGAFTATEKGIFVSCSAGNSGPNMGSVSNVAPWITTVGAGTIDRDFPAFTVLGNKNRLQGVSLCSGRGVGDKPIELVYKGDNITSNLCLPGSLDSNLVKGKVVLCDRGVNARAEKGKVVLDAGGVAMILANTAASGEELVADCHLLPAITIGKKDGDVIRNYVKTDPKPTALLSFGGTVLNVRPSPVVAAFSSRGPNTVTPHILKPDIIGPGVNILAGWSDVVGPSSMESDTRRTPFNIISGTSMSCPHISGLGALLKAAHPNWSPSAIRSALMTTAYTVDNTRSPLKDAAGGLLSTPWAHGAGHVDPQKALSPGLVYDISTSDYITFLCSLDYTIDQVKSITKHPNVTCPRKFRDPGQLNYPSFSIVFNNHKRVVRYTRVLTNVGIPGSTYQVTIAKPDNVYVTVKPATLFFKNVGDKQRYTVTFITKEATHTNAEFGSIVWSNSLNTVTSPVSFTWPRMTGQ